MKGTRRPIQGVVRGSTSLDHARRLSRQLQPRVKASSIPALPCQTAFISCAETALYLWASKEATCAPFVLVAALAHSVVVGPQSTERAILSPCVYVAYLATTCGFRRALQPGAKLDGEA